MRQCYLVDKPIKFRNIILPDESFFFTPSEHGEVVRYTNEYLNTIERVRQFALRNFEPLTQKKFFFFYGYKSIGEDRLARYFESKGYAIIQPEKLPLKDQLNILMNCENFASTVGSISHNILFMRDACDAILIPRFATGYIADGLNIRQNAIDQIHNLNVNYVDSNLSVFSHGNAGLYCYIISENLRERFGEKFSGTYSDEDFLTFLEYVRHSKNAGLTENSKELKYLEKILPKFAAQLMAREDLMQKSGVFVK